MKKIKITESQYKSIINRFGGVIKEDLTDQECIDKLQDNSGDKYKVLPISSYEDEQDECASNAVIKCILNILTSVGVKEKNFRVNKSGNNCYILLKSETPIVAGSSTSKRYLTIWGDGTLVYTHTLKNGIRDDGVVVVKVGFEGDFDCAVGAYTDLKYKNAISKDGEIHGKLDINIPIGGGSMKAAKILTKSNIPETGNIKDLIKKMYK